MMSSAGFDSSPACQMDFSCLRREKGGQIQVIFGPMFSGKTTELIRRLKRYSIANYRCLVVKYAKDIRYDEGGVATHDKQTLNAKGCLRMSELADDFLTNYDVIGVDEGQFFPDIVPFCERMAECGKIVIVAALDGTFQRKEFGSILQLIPIAENVVKLNAVCMICFGDASFTKRTTSDKEVEVIGGADKYLAVCRNCYCSSTKIASPNPKLLSPFRNHNRPILSDKSYLPNRKLFTSPKKLAAL